VTGCRTNTARLFWVLLTILVLWATQGVSAKKKPPLHPVNLNTASSAELQQVPGIGPATAEKILQARKSYGKFKSVNDLEAIRGIGPKKLDKMRKYLTVGTPPQSAKTNPHAAGAPSKTATGKAATAKAPTAKAAPPKIPPSAAGDEEEP